MELQAHIQKQEGEKARLEQLKTQVDQFERQRVVLQQRINVIEQLQRNRTGGQELLDALANTVTRTDTLWLTSLDRKGDGLTIVGTAGSINAVANFITQLKHSGYFDQVEIKESTQDDKRRSRADVQLHADGPVRFAAKQSRDAGDSSDTGGSARASETVTDLGSGSTSKTGAGGKELGGAMDISFKESPWYIQALVFVALAILLLAAGEYVPGLPVAAARNQLQTLHEQDTKLNQEVSALQVYERRYAEFQQEMNALNKQLETLKTIVPEDKETDDFMRLLQGAAAASGVQIRSLTADTWCLATITTKCRLKSRWTARISTSWISSGG